MTKWCVPMPDDIRKFPTPEGEISVNRAEVTRVSDCFDNADATLIEYAGRVRLVRVGLAEVLAWVRAGSLN